MLVHGVLRKASYGVRGGGGVDGANKKGRKGVGVGREVRCPCDVSLSTSHKTERLRVHTHAHTHKDTRKHRALRAPFSVLHRFALGPFSCLALSFETCYAILLHCVRFCFP